MVPESVAPTKVNFDSVANRTSNCDSAVGNSTLQFVVPASVTTSNCDSVVGNSTLEFVVPVAPNMELDAVAPDCDSLVEPSIDSNSLEPRKEKNFGAGI